MLADMHTPDSPLEKFGWLPEGLETVTLRLARADACAFKIGDIASKWSFEGPLDFEQVRRGNEVQTFLKSLRPVPPEAALLFSEAVNHLRAAIDNVVWYLIEQLHGDLSSRASTLVNMPIVETQEDLDRWTKRRLQAKITAFGADTPLGRRLRALQPFTDTRSGVPSMGSTLAAITRLEVESAHPLPLLQAYSNADKHRSITVGASRTFSSTDATPLAAQDLAHQELKVGDAMGPPTPWGKLTILETNTALMVHRPAPFSAWVNPVKEINALRIHVSQVVVPILLTGLEIPNGLPPGIELGDNGQSNRHRLAAGTWDDADARMAPLIKMRLDEANGRDFQIAPVAEDSRSWPR